MYWLLSILTIVFMMAILAITGSDALSVNSLTTIVPSFSIWPYLLAIATILIVISQYCVPNTALQATNKTTVSNKSATRNFLSIAGRAIYYSLVALLAVLLLAGSGLQALQSHSQAEDTEIATSMRVQALVTIEGISDSVYDPIDNSGYRQVATIDYIAPLIAELSAKDLERLTLEQVQASGSDYNDSQNNSALAPKHRILLNAYPKKSTTFSHLDSLNSLRPGDQVLMSMSLAPLASSKEALNNPTGFDSYRWLRARHIDGVATILSVGTPLGNTLDNGDAVLKGLSSTDSYLQRLQTRIDQGRWQLRQSFYKDWSALSLEQQQAHAVTLSLLTGDRSLINRETKDLYQLAGISHLLAISGTHVLFLAIIMAALAIVIFDQFYPALYRYLPRWQVRFGVMISAAFIYALFTGFDVPAARTAWMLLAIGAVRMTLLPVSTMRVLLALAIIMAWVDPYVLWQAGYWLSFIAVALILKYDAGLTEKISQHSTQSKHKTSQPRSLIHSNFAKAYSMFKRLFRLQCWLFIALLPITLLLFGKASLWGLIINLFAIGLFGWVIVPLNLLAGLCYLIAPSIAMSLWALVSNLVASLHELIIWLTAMPALNRAWLYTPINSAILLMALLVLIPWLLPRGLLSRWLALAPLSLLIMSVYANQQALIVTPTLYVLPTNDPYITAAILQHSIKSQNSEDQKDTDTVNWLILADHRPKDARTMISALTADQFAAVLEQQLGTLAVKRLEGIIVQTSATRSIDDNKLASINDKASVALLAQTARQLSQSLPTKHYWQAGKIDTPTHLNNTAKNLISAQDCMAGKTWQSADSGLTIQALTGWSSINDSNVWDCSLAIDSDQPIRILQYNAGDPLQSPAIAGQSLTDPTDTFVNARNSTNDSRSANEPAVLSQSRLVLDVSTHQRLWQLWSLLCAADTSLAGTNNNALDNQAISPTTWLAHSSSKVSSTVLIAQQTQKVVSYDSKVLETAFALDESVQTLRQTAY